MSEEKKEKIEEPEIKDSGSRKLLIILSAAVIIVIVALLLMLPADKPADTTPIVPVEPEINITPIPEPQMEPEGFCDYTIVRNITQHLTEYNLHWDKLKEFKMDYYYENGKMSRYLINGVKKELTSSDYVAILETLVCGEHALEAYDPSLGGGWTKEDSAWAKYEETGTELSIEKRFLNNGTVTVGYMEVSSELGFVTKLVEFTYPTNATNLDELNRDKTIEDWLQNYEEATYFKLNEFSYQFR